MLSILDYLNKKQTTFTEEAINEIDILILSQFSMLKFVNVLKETNISDKMNFKDVLNLLVSVTNLDKYNYIKDLYQQESFEKLVDYHQDKKNLDLLKELCASRRFRDLQIKYHVDKYDIESEKQFSATTFVYKNEFSVIVFRGTDATFVGWKEDFNMSYIYPIASHTDSKNYINTVYGYLPKKLYIAGHSKGGNLAVYGATHCKKNIQKNIVHVYTYDGPGFDKKFLKLPSYIELQSRITKIVPQGSIIGLLLEALEEIKVVESNGFWVNQHDPYSWQILDNLEFKYLKDVDISAKRTKISIDDWYASFNGDDKKEFINEMYRILIATNSGNFTELNSNIAKYLPKIISELGSMDKEKRKLVIDSFINLGKSHMKNLNVKVK